MDTLKQQKSKKSQNGQIGRTKKLQTFKFDTAFKRKVAQQYLQGNQSTRQIADEFDISNAAVTQWSKQYSSELAQESIVIPPMTEEDKNNIEYLKKHNESLKKLLEYEQKRNFALETLVDLADKQYQIDIRKNFGAKQPKE